jgi:CDP-diacylglycerol--serine O-phosphatidyltransferase
MKAGNRNKSERRRIRHRQRVLKTIGVLPSLATLGNLTCGLGAIYLCLLSVKLAGSDLGAAAAEAAKLPAFFPTFLSAAAYLLIAAMLFDGMDGRLARLTRRTSEFGGQLDSLADVVSFGVAPAVLVLCIAQPETVSQLATLPVWERAYWRAEWVMAAIFVCCAALRLARFNVENEEDESAHAEFRGLPTPGAAGAIIGLIIFHQDLLPELAHPRTVSFLTLLMPPFAMVLGLLMVSRFRYAHLINAVLRGRRPFWQVVSIAILILVGLVVEFHFTVAIATAAYALSGPVTAAVYKALGRRQPEEPLVSGVASEVLEEDATFDDAVEADAGDSDGEDAGGRIRFTG